LLVSRQSEKEGAEDVAKEEQRGYLRSKKWVGGWGGKNPLTPQPGGQKVVEQILLEITMKSRQEYNELNCSRKRKKIKRELNSEI